MLKRRPATRGNRAALLLLAGWLLCLSLTLAPAQARAATDVFGRSSDAAQVAQVNQPPETPRHALVLPQPLRRLLALSLGWQSELNRRIQQSVALPQDGTPPVFGWMLVLCAFLYGVLHALGPGHGKLAVGVYLGSRRARVAQAAVLSVWSALVQALSAIVLVGGCAWLFHAAAGTLMSSATELDLLSYMAMSAVGLWTLWNLVTHRDGCDCAVPLELTRGSTRHPDDMPATYLGHAQGMHGMRNRPALRTPVSAGMPQNARHIVLTGLAVGIRPCAGAIFVLVSALANHIFITGVLATLAMAAGVALTVLLSGLLGLALNRTLERTLARRRPAWRADGGSLRRYLAMGGALFITAFSLLCCLAIVSGYSAATLS